MKAYLIVLLIWFSICVLSNLLSLAIDPKEKHGSALFHLVVHLGFLVATICVLTLLGG